VGGDLRRPDGARGARARRGGELADVHSDWQLRRHATRHRAGQHGRGSARGSRGEHPHDRGVARPLRVPVARVGDGGRGRRGHAGRARVDGARERLFARSRSLRSSARGLGCCGA
jgi:hypothetical protein